MNKTVTVTGIGRLSLKPDQIEIRIRQHEVLDSYESSYKKMHVSKIMLDDVFNSFDIDSKKLKTISYSIDKEYENVQIKGEWKRMFKGYGFNHNLIIKIDLDHKLLFSVLSKLDKLQNTEMDIRYTVKDEEAAKNELLKEAVKDSRIKADVIAEALGLKVTDVLNADYSIKNINLYSDMSVSYCRNSIETYDSMEVEPEDINLNDNVTVTYLLG